MDPIDERIGRNTRTTIATSPDESHTGATCNICDQGVTMASLMNQTDIIDLLSVSTGLIGLVPSVRHRMCELCKAARDALATIARVRQQVYLNSQLGGHSNTPIWCASGWL